MDQKKIEAVFADKEFVAKIVELDSAEAVQAACKEKGVDLSVAEIDAIRKGVAQKTTGKELSDDDLEDVSGGIAVTVVLAIIGAIVGAVTAAGEITDRAVERRW